MFHPDIWRLIIKFCSSHSAILAGNVALSALSRGIETLIIPKLLAKIFTEISDLEATKKNVLLFLVVFVIEKIIYLLANLLFRKIEPLLTSFLSIEFITAIFRKYEATHQPINVAVCLEKINSLRETLESLVYYVYKLIPLFIVLVITVVSVYTVNVKLGVFVTASIVCLVMILYWVPKPAEFTLQKDAVYTHIEDIFNNMDFVAFTKDGLNTACAGIAERVKGLHQNRGKTAVKIGKLQALGYGVATIFYAMSVAYLYKLYADSEISLKNFEAYILTLGHLYKLTYDMSYHLPDFMQNLRIINTNGIFVNELFSHPEKGGLDLELDNYDLTMDKVSFSFDGKVLLNKFSCTIGEGSMVALYGTSGSGKTSFTNFFTDVLQPEQGVVTIGGHDIKSLSKATLKTHLANVRQNTTSLLQLTVYQNIIFGLKDTPELRKKIETLVEKYQLTTVFNNTPFLDLQVSKGGSSLSGGQKQTIHLLHALISERARVLILDEPTSALDEISKAHVLELLLDLNAEGRTLLIITHDPKVLALCQSALSFAAGRNPTLL